jgi:micrococcal nuclease
MVPCSLDTGPLVAQTVEVERKDTDRYGRTVAIISIGDQNINELMVQSGHAWVYRKYCKERFCSDWSKMEDAAKEMQTGLWSEPGIIPPWEFRRPGKRTTAVKENLKKS